jgi:hypothetical protein
VVCASQTLENAVTRQQLVRGSLSVALVSMVTACAGTPPADPQQDAIAKRFDRPAPDSGALYVYRSDVMGFGRAIDVGIAGGDGASLGYNTYMRLEGPPGPIDLNCRIGDRQTAQQITIEPGRTRYVEVSMKVGLTLPDCQLAEVSPDRGQAAIRAGKRVNPNRQ